MFARRGRGRGLVGGPALVTIVFLPVRGGFLQKVAQHLFPAIGGGIERAAQLESGRLGGLRIGSSFGHRGCEAGPRGVELRPSIGLQFRPLRGGCRVLARHGRGLQEVGHREKGSVDAHRVSAFIVAVALELAMREKELVRSHAHRHGAHQPRADQQREPHGPGGTGPRDRRDPHAHLGGRARRVGHAARDETLVPVVEAAHEALALVELGLQEVVIALCIGAETLGVHAREEFADAREIGAEPFLLGARLVQEDPAHHRRHHARRRAQDIGARDGGRRRRARGCRTVGDQAASVGTAGADRQARVHRGLHRRLREDEAGRCERRCGHAAVVAVEMLLVGHVVDGLVDRVRLGAARGMRRVIVQHGGQRIAALLQRLLLVAKLLALLGDLAQLPVAGMDRHGRQRQHRPAQAERGREVAHTAGRALFGEGMHRAMVLACPVDFAMVGRGFGAGAMLRGRLVGPVGGRMAFHAAGRGAVTGGFGAALGLASSIRQLAGFFGHAMQRVGEVLGGSHEVRPRLFRIDDREGCQLRVALRFGHVPWKAPGLPQGRPGPAASPLKWFSPVFPAWEPCGIQDDRSGVRTAGRHVFVLSYVE